VSTLLQTKAKEEVQYYSYSNKDYWAFVSANEKAQLQKDGKLPANMDGDDIPGAEFESDVQSDIDEMPVKKSSKAEETSKASETVETPLHTPSPVLSKKDTYPSSLNKRLFKQIEKK
jgi:hypothetical protein